MKSLETVLSSEMNCHRLKSVEEYLQKLNTHTHTYIFKVNLGMFENICLTIIHKVIQQNIFWSSNVPVHFSLLPVIKDMDTTEAVIRKTYLNRHYHTSSTGNNQQK